MQVATIKSSGMVWAAWQIALATVGLVLAARQLFVWSRVRRARSEPESVVVGVFHPSCDAAGGGERVLWVAVETILATRVGVHVRIIAKESLRGKEHDVLAKARERFGLQGRLDPSRIEFVFLRSSRLLSGDAWPRLTLLGQSLGAIIAGAEAIYRADFPLLFLDTVGAAFAYPLAWLSGSIVCCYTHYPTISTDMLARVHDRRPAYNNDKLISGSLGVSRIKYAYYLVFCGLYRLVGQFPKVVMVNSNWTRAHIEQLWLKAAHVVFPPCDTQQFKKERLALAKRRREIVSLGQFRPEKDHRLQIQALHSLAERIKGQQDMELPCLVMYGGCRDQEDRKRIQELEEFAEKLGVREHVSFQVNKPFDELKQVMGGALLGVHTMWNEHFGIAPVEMMAAGIVLVAHNSGGPKVDIIEHGKTGYLASNAEEYAECFYNVLVLFDKSKREQQPCPELDAIADQAEQSVERFSQELFEARFAKAFTILLD